MFSLLFTGMKEGENGVDFILPGYVLELEEVGCCHSNPVVKEKQG